MNYLDLPQEMWCLVYEFVSGKKAPHHLINNPFTIGCCIKKDDVLTHLCNLQMSKWRRFISEIDNSTLVSRSSFIDNQIYKIFFLQLQDLKYKHKLNKTILSNARYIFDESGCPLIISKGVLRWGDEYYGIHARDDSMSLTFFRKNTHLKF